MLSKTKFCAFCRQTKLLDNFSFSKTRRHYNNKCRLCTNAASHETYLRNRKKILSRQKLKYKEDPGFRERCKTWHASYSITGRRKVVDTYRRDKDRLTHYLKTALKGSRDANKRFGYAACTANVEELRAAWTAKCHLCDVSNEQHVVENKKWIHMDHCHTTGRFRGFLCVHCNKLVSCLERSSHLIDKATRFITDKKG